MRDPTDRLERLRGKLLSRCWLTLLANMALAGNIAFAQVAGGALAGELTDIHSKPLAGVTVTLRNALTRSEVSSVTGKGGIYRFNGLPPGEYTLEAASALLGNGRVGGVHISSGFVSRIQTAVAMNMELPLPEFSSPRVDISGAPLAPSRGPPVVPADSPASLEAQLARLQHNLSVALELTPAEGEGKVEIAFEISSALPLLPSIALVSSPPRPALLQAAGSIAAIVVANDGATAEFNVTGEEIERLPLPGRNWENFALNTPVGQTSDPDSEDIGSNRLQPSITVDGANTQEAFSGRTRGHSNSEDLAAPGESETSLREFRVAARGEIAASDAPGGQIRVETRSGTHQLHGQALLFSRQSLLGARNPLTQWIKESAPGSSTSTPQFTAFPFSPSDSQSRWGSGVGGQLPWKKIFWFASVDGSERNHPAVSTVRHPDHFFAQPSNDEMQVLSARLGLSGVDPVSEGVQAYSKMLESLAGLLGPAPRTSRQWNGFGRLDWKAGERHRFVLTGSDFASDSPGGGLSRASETYGNHSFGHKSSNSLLALTRWDAFITPNLLASTQGSMSGSALSSGAETPSPFEQAFHAGLWKQLPQITVDSGYGFTIGNPARFGPGKLPNERVYEAQENLSWVHGPLLLRTGFNLRHSADSTSFLHNQTGTYSYTSVENFVSDALVFARFGLTDALDPMQQHNCDQRGKAWRDSAGQLHGLGYLPCYSYFRQTLGPTNWLLSTNDWAGFATAQLQPSRQLVITGSLRWDHEQLPPPIMLVDNPDLPLTQHMPSVGSAWGPRLGLAWGRSESRLPVLRFSYGLFAGRTNNGVLETALTQTGSLKGDLNFMMRPTDNLQSIGGGAPPFPYVLSGDPASVEKPGAVEFAPNFHNAQIHQGMTEMDLKLPGRILISASAMVSLGRRLPITMDTNYDPAANPKTITFAVIDGTGKGPIKQPQITVPFFASWGNGGDSAGRLNGGYQQITEIVSKANSTYEAATVRVSRYVRSGLSLNARYTYGHAMDWNPNESEQVTGSSVFDPTNFALEYGTSNLDVRHSASAMAIWQTPRRPMGPARWLTSGWMLSGTMQFHSGLPYTMRTAGSIAREFEKSGALVVGLGPGMNGYGGDDRVYGVGRNTFRYPPTWKADMRLGRRFGLGHGREVELVADSFNLLNHRNVTEVETTGYSIQPGTVSGSFPTLNFLTGLKSGQTEFGLPMNINAVDFYRERQFDLGLRLRF